MPVEVWVLDWDNPEVREEIVAGMRGHSRNPTGEPVNSTVSPKQYQLCGEIDLPE